MRGATTHKIIAGIEARRYLLLLLFTAIYGICAIDRAAGKPFWSDEIVTLIAAKAPSAGEVWKLTLAMDVNPPLPQLMTHFAIQWFGLNEVTGRLPAIVGFWVLCLCLYYFVARRKGVVFGLCALLLPAATHAFYYAAEARPYGPELGFCGLALIAWQAAAEGRHRVAALCGLALSLSAMMFCHYFGVLIYLPLGAAELVRAWRTRRPDWGMWTALALGCVPLVWRVASIIGVVKGFVHTWSPAYLRQGLEFWEEGLGQGAAFAALLLGLIALFARQRPDAVEEREAGKVPEYEWVAVAMMLAVPLASVLVGVLVTHMFTERYALIGLVGFCLLAPMMIAELLGQRGTAGILMLAVLAWGLGIRSADHPTAGNPFYGETMLHEAVEQGPVVVPDGLLYLQMWWYAPERLKPRLLYVVDNAASVKYMNYETVDDGLGKMRQYVPVNVRTWAEFARDTHEFTALQSSLRPAWILQRVVEEGATVEVKKAAPYRTLLNVRLRN